VILGAAGPMLCYPIEQRPDGRLVARLTFDLPDELPAKGRKLGPWLTRTFVPYLPLPLAQQVAAAILARDGQLELAPTVRLPAPPATGPGFALVGDAAGCSHPITASGMTMGLLDAEILGDQARRRADSPTDAPWLGARELRAYRAEHDRYVPTRQALADAIFEAFRGADEGARAIRTALFRYWGQGPRNRRRSLALLACSEGRPHVFLSEYIKTARHAVGGSLAPSHARHLPVGDRLRRVEGAVRLAGDKLGLVASVAWAQVKPGFLVR
jgi:2-polyprenyl-6-methoxyphenol hydroxylase-like FAD-dependent oxidoreductase